MSYEYKIRDKKTGKYKLNKNGRDSVNISLGYANGRPIGFSVNDIEGMKYSEDEDERRSKECEE